MATFYAVAIYDLRQSYGGPEEGGWWYMDGDLVEVDSVWYTESLANGTCRKLNEGFDPDRNHYGEGSTATVVQVPREESIYRHEKCHMTIEEDQFTTRWDIPVDYKDGDRPHYC